MEKSWEGLGELRNEEIGGKMESGEGKREHKAMAFLSSGGILRDEKLEGTSCGALRGTSPARGQSPALSGMRLCLRKRCFCCSGGLFQFHSYASF